MKLRGTSGYVMVTVLGIMTIATVVGANLIQSTTNSIKADTVINLINDRYYNVEQGLGQVTAWLRDNNDPMADYFEGANFNHYFELRDSTVDEVFGDNEATDFAVPSLVKVKGSSNDTPMITNNTNFGISNFPVHNGYDPVSDFQATFPNADNGGVNLRISVIWAEVAGDDFSPVLRVDAITGNNPDKGVHIYSNMHGTFSWDDSGSTSSDPTMVDMPGFYGLNKVTFSGNSSCKSRAFSWNGTTSQWDISADKSNCVVVSPSTVSLSGGSGSKVYGAVFTSTEMTASSRAKVTSNNANGCDGTGCTITYSLPSYGTYNDYCPSGGANITVSSNMTLAPGCYDSVTVENKRTLTLNNYTTNPANLTSGLTANPDAYYIKTLNLKSSKSVIQTGAPSSSSDAVEVFVEGWIGNFNGKQVVNTNNAPHQFRLIYGGSYLKMNGTARMHAHVFATATGSKLDILGTFDFYGFMHASQIDMGGNGRLYSDETAGQVITVTPPESKIVFKSIKASQRFR